MVDMTPQETSFSEMLSSMNKVYLQNATGTKACWCKYIVWPDELMSNPVSPMSVSAISSLAPAEAEEGLLTVSITAEEKPSSLPSGKFTQCRFRELCHGRVDRSLEKDYLGSIL